MHWKQVGSATLALVAFVIPWAWPEMPSGLHFVVWPTVAWGVFYTVRGWMKERRGLGKMALEAPQIVIFMGLAIAAFGLSWQIYRSQFGAPDVASSQQNLAQPKRAFDQATERKFLGLLRERLPDKGWVEIKYVSLELRPFAQRLAALFDSAGWQTNLNGQPIEPYQVREVNGVLIGGWNEHFLDAVIGAFQEAGITDIHRELRKSEMPRENPKWPMVQQSVWLEIGFPEKRAGLDAGRRSKEARAKLRYFYTQIGDVLDETLPDDLALEEFEKYVARSNRCVSEAAAWIGANIGDAARARFLDKSGMLAAQVQGAINPRHNAIILNLSRYKQNLQAMIESEAWA